MSEAEKLAEAIASYLDWQRQQAELKERLRFERRIRRGKKAQEAKAPGMTAAELDALCVQDIDEIQAGIEAYDERAAIQAESREAETRGKTTTDYAIEALQQPDTSWGKHAVARAWLKSNDPHVRVFSKARSA